MEKKRLDHIYIEHERHVAAHNAEKQERIRKMNKSKFKKTKLNNNLTLGQRVADKVAQFGGSWTFIIVFVLVLISWMTMNVIKLFGANFDPYPFILLNLFLSCIAAIQAPIIMMSQNRSAERSEVKADNDAKVNMQSSTKQDLIMEKQDHAFDTTEDLFRLTSGLVSDVNDIKTEINNIKSAEK